MRCVAARRRRGPVVRVDKPSHMVRHVRRILLDPAAHHVRRPRRVRVLVIAVVRLDRHHDHRRQLPLRVQLRQRPRGVPGLVAGAGRPKRGAAIIKIDHRITRPARIIIAWQQYMHLVRRVLGPAHVQRVESVQPPRREPVVVRPADLPAEHEHIRRRLGRPRRRVRTRRARARSLRARITRGARVTRILAARTTRRCAATAPGARRAHRRRHLRRRDPARLARPLASRTADDHSTHTIARPPAPATTPVIRTASPRRSTGRVGCTLAAR
jgi:hypothetical protein